MKMMLKFNGENNPIEKFLKNIPFFKKYQIFHEKMPIELLQEALIKSIVSLKTYNLMHATLTINKKKL